MAARRATSGSCLRKISIDSALSHIKYIGYKVESVRDSFWSGGLTTRVIKMTTAVITRNQLLIFLELTMEIEICGKLTHSLGPESNKLGLSRSPCRRKHGVKSTCETLDDTETRDTGSHRTETYSSKGGSGNMTDRNDRYYDKRIFKKMSSIIFKKNRLTFMKND